MKINKDNIRKNSQRVDPDYKVRYKVMLDYNDECKYKIPYKGPFVIKQCWTNGMVALKCGAIKIRYNIRQNRPYTYDTNVEYIKC